MVSIRSLALFNVYPSDFCPMSNIWGGKAHIIFHATSYLGCNCIKLWENGQMTAWVLWIVASCWLGNENSKHVYVYDSTIANIKHKYVTLDV